MAKGGPHVSISGEELFYIGDFSVTNSIVTTVIVTVVFVFLGAHYASQIQKKGAKSTLFYFIQFMVESLYDLFSSVLRKQTPVFFPLIGSLFFFIILNNWSGLLPGVGSILISVEHYGETHMIPLFRAATADLNTTIALAIVSVFLTQYFGVKYLGVFEYTHRFFDFSNFINFFVGLLELVSEIAKLLSFSVRLFGNIFAGEVLLTVIAFLIPWGASFPLLLFEYFVGFVQALVFSMLTAVFISLAISKH